MTVSQDTDNWIRAVSLKYARRSMETIRSKEMNEEVYTVTILCEDESVHTDEKPMCPDVTCPCHSIDNFEAVWRLKTQLAQGLITWAEHIRIWRGETI